MLPMNSSKVMPLSVLVVTFLKTSPAVLGFAGACAAAWPAIENPATVIPATVRVSRLDQNFMFCSSRKVYEGPIVLMTAVRRKLVTGGKVRISAEDRIQNTESRTGILTSDFWILP